MLPRSVEHEREHAIRAALDELTSEGTVRSECGEHRGERLRICCHSDRGPEDQEKDSNEDFVATWIGNGDSARYVEWALAIADGVSSSYFGREAAELASWTALAGLLRGNHTVSQEIGKRAVSRASQAIRRLGARLHEESENWSPQDVFGSTWEYVLRKGKFLQTTLVLAWQHRSALHLVSVGDGGALIWSSNEQAPSWLTPTSTPSHVVHAMGPDSQDDLQLDVDFHCDLPEAFQLAVFTDGLQTAFFNCPQSAFGRGTLASAENQAKYVVEQLQREFPSAFDDNLTLALVSRDAASNRTTR